MYDHRGHREKYKTLRKNLQPIAFNLCVLCVLNVIEH